MSRRTNTAVVALATVVLLVFGIAWLVTSTNGDGSSPPAVAPVAGSDPVGGRSVTASTPFPATASTTAAAVLPPWSPIPSGGVAPVVPPAAGSVPDPGAITLVEPPVGEPTETELGSPQAAAVAWAARWCPFHFTDPYGAAEERARPVMTAAGWAEFNPTASARAWESWRRTVAARELGRCAAPTASVLPAAPRRDGSAIVLITVDRVITADGAPAYAERLADTRIVLRGPDGRWRVDTATRGG